MSATIAPITQSDDQAAAPEKPEVGRREFLMLAVAAAAGAAAGGVVATPATAQPTPPSAEPPIDLTQPFDIELLQQAVPQALGNGEPPAVQYQPWPGGTGAYFEKVIRERGKDAFERKEHKIEGWHGPVPTSDEEIAFLPVHRLSKLIKDRKISPVKLTQIYLDRLKRFNGTLQCAVTILEDSAMADARRAEAEINDGKYRGPLHGIPWGVKDLFAVKGAPTTWGAEDFQTQTFDYDAEVVVRLREAGAILIAKLATGRFASGDQWFRGMTRNPWNVEQGSSGSSAGPASATAAGCVAFGIGTETSGSIVSPTTRCGLSGLRPTFGRVSRYGGMVLSWTQDKVGPICRTVEDCALVFSVTHGADEKDPASITAPFRFERDVDLAKLRIGYDDRAPEEFIAKLKELGAKPVLIGNRPGNLDGGGGGGRGRGARAPVAACDSTRMAALLAAPPAAGGGGGGGGGGGVGNAFTVEAAAAFDFYINARSAEVVAADSTALAEQARQTATRRAAVLAGCAPAGGFGGGGGGGATPVGAPPVVPPAGGRAMFLGGRTIPALDFLQGQRRRLILMREMATFMKDYDLYVTGRGDIVLTNQTGHPCVVLPTGMTEGEHSQPRCTVMVGQLYGDDVLLSVANKYQVATEWHKRHPVLA